MPLRQAKGNMYEWLTHTWNPIKGRCAHDCSYCYMKRWGELPDLRLDSKEMETDLGKDNFIFIGSSTDIFADNVPESWIRKVLFHTSKFDNRYLFQTKNPSRFRTFFALFPEKTVLGLTLETNRDYVISKAPSPIERVVGITPLTDAGLPIMVTIEPVMEFDLKQLVRLVRITRPQWVNIGANTRRDVKLPKPSIHKVNELTKELKRFTRVHLKSNLRFLG